MFYNGLDAFTRAGVCLRFHLPTIPDFDGEEEVELARRRYCAASVAVEAADGLGQLEQHGTVGARSSKMDDVAAAVGRCSTVARRRCISCHTSTQSPRRYLGDILVLLKFPD